MSYTKGFYWLSRAWYGKANLNQKDLIDEILIGSYAPEGGVDANSGEFAIRWMKLGNSVTPRVEIFEDAWNLFEEFSDFFFVLTLHHGMNPDPETIVDTLENLGYKDLTPYVDPHEEQHKKEGLIKSAAPDLYEALKATLEWIDAVPEDIPLPTMPGFDRDWVDSVVLKAEGKED